jgi:O-antigen/teichoic acid export membrane protein
LKISPRPSRQEFVGLLPQFKMMAQNRLLGVLQGPAQQPLVGLLVGPAAVALFDVLTRLPRFLKTAIGLLGSALIPVAAKLDAGNDTARMSKLASWGLLLSVCAAIPPSAGAALMGEPLLRLWVGPTFSAYWHWHALMFVLPVAASLVSFGSTALLVRPLALAKVNRIGAIQLTLQYALAIVLLGELQERALLLSQALSVVVASGFIGALLVREHRLEGRLLWRVGAIIALGFALTILYGSLRDPRLIEGWTNLASQFAAWCLVYWAAIWVLVLERPEKRRLRAAFFSLMAPVGEARRSGT